MSDMNKRVKKLREDKNMSLNQFGDSLGGVSKSYLSMIENNERPVTEAMTKRIVKKFTVNKDWLERGAGEIYDRERTALKDIYLKQRKIIIRRYTGDCERFISLLIPAEFEWLDSKGNGLTVFDRFPNLSLQKFYMSEIEPKSLIESLIALYKNIENAVQVWLKFVYLLKDPALGFAEFYQEDRTEIDRIENNLLNCLGLVANNRTVIGKNIDNNSLLGIGGYFELLHKYNPYKDNIEAIEFMREKRNKPPP